MTRLLFILPIAFLCAVHAEKPKPKVTLCVGNYQTEAQAVEQLKRMAATHGNLAQWKVRAAAVRQQILTGSQLSPWPKRTPLKPILKNKRTYKGYTVEAAAFEARPGFLCTAICIGRWVSRVNGQESCVRTGTLARPVRTVGVGYALISRTAAPRSRAWARLCFRMT